MMRARKAFAKEGASAVCTAGAQGPSSAPGWPGWPYRCPVESRGNSAHEAKYEESPVSLGLWKLREHPPVLAS